LWGSGGAETRYGAMRCRCCYVIVTVLGACATGAEPGGAPDDDDDDQQEPPDARPDRPDASLHPDATASLDGAMPDAPRPDAAVPDAAVPDAAVPDAAMPDAGPSTAVIFANGQTALYRVNPSTYAVTLVASFTWPASVGNDAMADIAIAPDGAVIGASSSRLYRCDASTAVCTKIGDLAHTVNGLGYVPQGVVDASAETLLGVTNDGAIYKINASTAAMTSLGHFSNGHASSGDLVYAGSTLYAGVNAGGGNDSLARVATGTGATTLVGSTNKPWMWGLAASGTTLVGFTLARDIVTIDPSSGAATTVGSGPVDWYGAAGR